ncbi:hypothetical protein FHS19_006157 [Paenibacillus rhizosphaerae]|uniref:Lipoprotein SmpA/OmlA domain-containing protein n=1 Tax=Paenibacillus rhizosphaerae TaxID=297318 RepID=A0A839TW87_9BACL|nr:hypothetical protein [Paenibacillus rhizosphaerae]MBB3131434.1 hypothetical protein [Paenibacillus rhizosphaerae]
MKKLVLISSLLLLLFLSGCQNRFSSDAWIDQPGKRSHMVDDLLAKNDLKGKTQDEIISLLGEPEQRITSPVPQFVYYLGRTGLGVDDLLFKLQFDAKGKLESHEITHD